MPLTGDNLVVLAQRGHTAAHQLTKSLRSNQSRSCARIDQQAVTLFCTNCEVALGLLGMSICVEHCEAEGSAVLLLWDHCGCLGIVGAFGRSCRPLQPGDILLL